MELDDKYAIPGLSYFAATSLSVSFSQDPIVMFMAGLIGMMLGIYVADE